MARGPYLTAREAAEALGISLPTLYAYVSRGLVRSEAAGGSARNRRYHAEDIQRLKERRQQRRDPDKVAEGALHWGLPVMESSVTLLADGTFYYRGHDALALAATHSAEQVAALIWTGDASSDAVARLFGPTAGTLPPDCAELRPHLSALTPADAFKVLLPLAAVDDVAAYDTRPDAVAQAGARILRLLVTIAVGEQSSVAGIAQALQHGWAPQAPQAKALFDTALILCADQELNVTSFTARCVASAGSTPYDVVSAGLCALSGSRHAGRSARIEAFLRQVGTPDGAHASIADRLKRGEEIPGFGHPLYPGGDPR
jgi:citrate synthase